MKNVLQNAKFKEIFPSIRTDSPFAITVQKYALKQKSKYIFLYFYPTKTHIA